MTKILRAVLALALALSGALATAGIARADVENSTGTNVQEGDNRSTGNQRGSSSSGDAVGGQVTGVVSSGRTSVDATNVSRDSDVSSGEASGTNNANTFTGLNTAERGTTSVGDPGASDITGSEALNLQEGDNNTSYSQSASYTTGDGVAGQVIGAVTAAGGSTSIVAANTSNNVSVDTGDAEGTNDLAAFTGLNVSDTLTVNAADIEDSCTFGCANLQEGDNRTRARQSSAASTGDGVAGQVIGAVSAGATSIDATNRSDGVDVQTGHADTDNNASLFTGLNVADTATVGEAAAEDITGSCNFAECANVQEGDNRTTANQSASASSGDGVAGSVIGAVTSAGGSASIVAANTSTNSDVSTGDAESNNDLAAFVGLNLAFESAVVASDIDDTCSPGECVNLQEGDNRLSGSQTARSSTGDGVAGQVLGVVSAGATSVDATNRSDDVSVDTGEAESNNDASQFVGLNFSPTLTVGGGVGTSDISSATAVNVQEGDNRKSLSQSADASSGDAVAGQVGGVVTSAGGSASVVLANTSTGIDASTGESEFDNDENSFVGLNVTGFVL